VGERAPPPPKKRGRRNPLKNFSPLGGGGGGVKTSSSSLIIFQRANYQRGILFISTSAIEGHFEGKTSTPWEGHQGGLVLAQCPGSPGTCNPEETGLPGHPVS